MSSEQQVKKLYTRHLDNEHWHKSASVQSSIVQFLVLPVEQQAVEY